MPYKIPYMSSPTISQALPSAAPLYDVCLLQRTLGLPPTPSMCPVSLRPVPLQEATYQTGRLLSDEQRYILDRRYKGEEIRAGNMLDKPSLLLNPWAVRATTTTTQDLKAGSNYFGIQGAARSQKKKGAPRRQMKQMSTNQSKPMPLDFSAASVVMSNLAPGPDGVVNIPLASLTAGGATSVQVVAVDEYALVAHPMQLEATRTMGGMCP